MTRPFAFLKTLEDLPDNRPVRKAKANLSACGCLETWKQFMHLSNEGKNLELDIARLRFLIDEQCLDNRDIDFQLSERDRSLPFPKSVRRCLINKLKNARSLRQDAFARVGEIRHTLEEGHSHWHPRAK